ncbi:hypothetical protein [Nitratidesulfovibrio vulgaris]|nr:hypothetical protein [Nitratidesulfovibrio vulgaris]ADP86967.1 hypothetical protein Deval_1816 [Nitratidesulfovibrio vulgaris RCH1]
MSCSCRGQGLLAWLYMGIAGVFILMVPCNVRAGSSPQPYVLCRAHKVPLKGMPDFYGVKILVTTKARDMSTMSMEQLAATAYSAMEYFNAGEYADALLVNVLLTPSCADTGLSIARAQVGEGRRIVSAARKSCGPSAAMLCVADAVARAKRGSARMTSDADYAKAATVCKVSARAAKDVHLALAEYALHEDYYEVTENILPKSPSK